jgi:hypothetical protein
MRVYSAAFLISMAFATPAMALSSGPIFDPRAPSICNIGQTKATAQSALPGNEIVRPGTRINLRAVVIRIVLRVLGCRVETPVPPPRY